MKLFLITSKILWVSALSFIYCQVAAAPTENAEPEKKLMTVEFVLLHAIDDTALATEAWKSLEEIPPQIQSALERLQNQENDYNEGLAQNNQQGELMATLSPLLRQGLFKVIYATQWQQPQFNKRHTHTIERSINDFGAYDFTFGTLALEERSALVAQLNINIINTLLFEPKNTETPFMPPSPFEPHQYKQQHQIQLPALPTTPLIFLTQQRQIKPNSIHYFDHPIIPAFLLVSD